jgi:diguanylate cyclase (GGDEF)-like protein
MERPGKPMAWAEPELGESSVLVIDDSDTERQQILQVLKKEGIFATFYEASDGLMGFRLLIEKRPDLIICDLVMPACDGLTFLKMRQVRPEEDIRLIPILILTSIDNLQVKTQMFELGAQDYIIKPVDPAELVARVKVHLKLKKLQEQLVRQNQLLQRLSTTDSLTELYNRRHLLRLYEQAFASATRYGYDLSVAMMDVDHFKAINDAHGHLAGDRVLQEFAKWLRQSIRKGDIVGRYGGEEFLVILPHTPLKGALTFAKRFRQTVEAHEILLDSGESVRITVSVGVASWPEVPVTESWDLLRLADAALYEAKRAGRNRVCAYPPEADPSGDPQAVQQ